MCQEYLQEVIECSINSARVTVKFLQGLTWIKSGSQCGVTALWIEKKRFNKKTASGKEAVFAEVIQTLFNNHFYRGAFNAISDLDKIHPFWK
jgi:hypothetical protein